MQLTDRVYDADEHLIKDTIRVNGKTITRHYCREEKFSSKTYVHQGDQLLSLTLRADSGEFEKTTYKNNQPAFRLVVNGKGQLVQIQIFEPGKKEALYRFSYDTYGNLVKQWARPGKKPLKEVTEYWREPPRTTRFSRWNGNAISFEEGTPDSPNEYDGITKGLFKNGKINLIVAFDDKGHARHIEKYRDGNLHNDLFLSENGVPTSQMTHESYHEGTMHIKTFSTITYDTSGQIIKTTGRENHYYPDDILRTEIFQINEQLVSKVFYIRDNNNQLTSKIRCEYNDKLQCDREFHFDANNNFQKGILYEYNIAGKCIDSYNLIAGKWISTKNPKKEIPASARDLQITGTSIPQKPSPTTIQKNAILARTGQRKQ